MELKRILSFILVTMMLLCTTTFPVLAENTGIDRYIVMTPSSEVVHTGETVTITVSVSDSLAGGLKFASWDLNHNDQFFEFVSAELVAPYSDSNVTLMYRNGNVFTPDVYAKSGTVLTGNIMVYTFKALMEPTVDEPFKFDNVDIRDGNEGWTEEDVSGKTEKEETDVTINIRHFDELTKKYDGVVVTNNTLRGIYDGAPHTFAVSAVDDDGNPQTVSYTKNGSALAAGELIPTFTETGTHLIGYKIEKDGYETIDDTFTVTIEPAEFSTQFKFAGEDITNDILGDRYSFTYDGNGNIFEIVATTVDGSAAEIKYGVGSGAMSTTLPEITTAGTYEIRYQITAANHKTIDETIFITVEPAPLRDIKIGFTDGGVTEDITAAVADGAYEFPYDGQAHELVVIEPVGTVDGANVDIKYSIDGVTFTNTPPSISEAGMHEITYQITADNHATVTKTIMVTITDPEFKVEVLLDEAGDWIENNKLVLVYTNASRVSFKYDKMQMFDVSGGQYKYNNQERYERVYALVVPALDTNTLEAYEDKVTVDYALYSDYVIDYSKPYDLNESGEVNQNDIISAYSILEQQSFAQMKGIIKLDSDFSKTARDVDITPIIHEVYFKNN